MSTFIENLSNNMLVLPISMGRISLEVKTKRGADALKSALGVADGVRAGGTIGALGALTDMAADLINRPVGHARTYTYSSTLAFIRAHRIVTTIRTPEHLARYAEFRHALTNGIDEFMPQYEVYYKSTNGVADMGNSQISIPHPDAVREKAYINIGVPQQIRPADLDGMNLPAGLAADIAARTDAHIIKQAEAAKTGAVEELMKAVDNVEKQLTSGKRLHDSLIENAKNASRNLREFTDSFDHDVRLIRACEIVDERIASSSLEQVRNSETLRAQAVRAATTASESLKKVASAPPISSAPAQAGTIITGDSILADILD
jgi:hypothetical protein|tara:strand:- start:2857 stop:3810 length:954 start_codon:yes stop_codon:yes gene_type:complete